MTKIVVDSGVAIKWLNKNKEDDLDNADSLLTDVKNGKVEIIAPELMKYEIGKILFTNKRLSQLESKLVLNTFFHLPIRYISLDWEMAKEAHAIASAYQLSYITSIYLATAERENAKFITIKSSENIIASGIKIVVLKDY